MQITNEIQTIADKIKETVNCEKIYLFGSYAYGVPKIDSDYDFYVIMPDDEIRPMEAMRKIYGQLSKTKMNIPVDVLATNHSQFEKRSGMRTLEKKVFNDGVILYERNGISI